MALILTGISAAVVYLSRTSLVPVHSREECATILTGAAPRAGEIAALVERPRYQQCLAILAATIGTGVDQLPVEVLVGSDRCHRRLKGVCCHTWSGPLPDGGICSVTTGDGEDPIHVVSPAFHLLLRCRELDFAEALTVAMGLCGTYDLRPDLPAGFSSDRAPLTSAAAIRKVVRAVEVAGTMSPGITTARLVARSVVDGAASPRESGLCALAVCPTRLGGAGLPKPILNHEVTLTPQARLFLPHQRTIRYDLHWPEQRLACEYDSSWFHSDPARIGHDNERRLAARAMGDEVVSISHRSLANRAAADALLADLARTLTGRRPRPLSKRTMARRTALRRVLLGRHRWW